MGSGYEVIRAVARCIRIGHPPADAWGYTPRQLTAWMDLDYRDQCLQKAMMIEAAALGASGNGKAIKDAIKKLLDEGQ